MVEKCLEYLKVAGRALRLKKSAWISREWCWKSWFMRVWNPCYQWAKCRRTGRQGAANTSPSAHRTPVCLGWVSHCGIAEGVWMSTSSKRTPSSDSFSSSPLILFAAYGDQENEPKVLYHLWDASSCWWLCTKWRKLLRTKVKSGSRGESLLAKRKCFAGTILTGSRKHHRQFWACLMSARATFCQPTMSLCISCIQYS